MDTRSLADRTATWQAALVYREQYEITEPDETLEEVRLAHEAWQDAELNLRARSWGLEIALAEEEVEDALDKLTGRSMTSASVHKKLERWHQKRQRVADLKTAQANAQTQVRTAYAHYLRVLEQQY
jgi:hypothetical protein